MDMATGRIVTQISHDRRLTLHFKFEQYDRYLTGRRFAEKYRSYGEFGSFTLLFVTLNPQRVENLRAALSDLPTDLAPYYRFGVFDEVLSDFLGTVWHSRLPTDEERYGLGTVEIQRELMMAAAR